MRDSQGGALPGAEITLSGGRTVIADVDGRIAFANLGPGSYEVSARLAGFRTQTQQVHFGELSTVQVVFALSLATLAEVLPIVPEPHDAYREADAIVCERAA